MKRRRPRTSETKDLKQPGPSRQQRWRQARRVLCIRLDSLGDVLMTTPALRALKESAPGRQLTLLTSKAGAQAVPLIPEIDRYIPYEAPWMKSTASREDPAPDFSMIDELREGCYDAAVIFTVFSQNPLPAALMAFLAEIPLRLAHCRENPYQLLTDWVPDPDAAGDRPIRHEVRRQLDLVASVGCTTGNEKLSLQPPPEASMRLRKLLAKKGLLWEAPWLVIHPGASAPSRRYAPQGFAAAADELAGRHGFQIVFTGSQAEGELVKAIQAQMGRPSISLAGLLDLADLVALLDMAPLLISNNTGPVHIAAAVGAPVVDLYALTNPQHTPWQIPSRVLNHDVPCKYCFKSVCPMQHHNCLRLVSPQEVVQAAVELYQAVRKPALTDLEAGL